MNLIELARKLRPYIEKAAASLDDRDALEAVSLFPAWSGDGRVYRVGDRVREDGVLYGCLTEHASQDGWMPSASPSLWAKVLIPDEGAVYPWEQPESTNAYMTGDRVTYGGKTWVSTTDYNVWVPGEYGWEPAE